MSDRVNDAIAKLKNVTIKDYLSLMRDTETPPMFHVWSLMSAASACLTRRCWFQMGSIRIMPNQYIMLVGTPGVRKSEGIKFVRNILKDVEGLRFGPNNTAGRPQGLISAMIGKRGISEDVDDEVDKTIAEAGLNLDMGVNTDEQDTELGHTHVLNRHALYVAESELAGFLGMRSTEFSDFLNDMWDRSGMDSYLYQLKRETGKIELPCLNMIGAITPMGITSYLPPTAIGQGFTSRVIMVYEDRGKKVAWPDLLDDKKVMGFRKLLRYIFEAFDGEFEVGPGVRELVTQLYDYEINIDDVRFLHYAQRRQTHMIKAAMSLAALRMSNEVTVEDIQDAHDLLTLTEERMAECLGEYGLSPLALATSRIREKLKSMTQPITLHRLLMSLGSDVKRQEAVRALYELGQDDTIIEVNLRDPNGIARTGYVWPRETNAFKAHDVIKVPYLHDDGEPRPGDKKGAKPLTKKLAEDADMLGSAHDPQTGPIDYDSIVFKKKPEQDSPSLTEQGYTSVSGKLTAFLTKRERLN